MAKVLKIGDKVVVKNRGDIPEGVQFGWADDMSRFCGKTVTIRAAELRDDGTFRYRIKEDYGNWAWSIDMFKKVVGTGNPQAITDVKKLDDNSLFRVKGVFKGKALICRIRLTDEGYTFFGVVSGVTLYLPTKTIERRLKKGDISIMCVERA